MVWVPGFLPSLSRIQLCSIEQCSNWCSSRSSSLPNIEEILELSELQYLIIVFIKLVEFSSVKPRTKKNTEMRVRFQIPYGWWPRHRCACRDVPYPSHHCSIRRTCAFQDSRWWSSKRLAFSGWTRWKELPQGSRRIAVALRIHAARASKWSKEPSEKETRGTTEMLNPVPPITKLLDLDLCYINHLVQILFARRRRLSCDSFISKMA